MGKVLYSIRINSDLLEKLRRLAAERDTSVSEIIRRKLQNFDLNKNSEKYLNFNDLTISRG